MMSNAWKFEAGDYDETYAAAIRKSVKVDGKARFGWSSDDSTNLNLPEDQWHPECNEQKFLKRIGPGDWIVYVNLTAKANCFAVKVLNKPQDQLYVFGDTEDSIHGDFRQYIQVDRTITVEFCYGVLSDDMHKKVAMSIGRGHQIHHNDLPEILDNLYSALHKNDKCDPPE